MAFALATLPGDAGAFQGQKNLELNQKDETASEIKKKIS